MARRRSVKRRERRQGGRGLLIKLGVGLVVLVPVLYFAFTKLFFDPFEGTQPPFQALVPRDVDLFVHRQALASDFEEFPEPRVVARLKRTRAFRELEKTAWWQALEWPREMESVETQVRTSFTDAPLDPLADVLGTEVAMVGRLPAGGAGEAQYALLARINDRAKLALELLDTEAALQRAVPGAKLTIIDDPDTVDLQYRRLDLPPGLLGGAGGGSPAGANGGASSDGGDGAADTWYYGRKLDLLVVSRSEALLRDVLRGTEAGAEASLGLSRLYHDHLPALRGRVEERFSVEFLLDVERLLKRIEAQDTLVEKHPDALLNALTQLVDPRLFGDTVGRLEVDDDIVLHAHADLAAPDQSIARAGLLGAPTFKASERLTAMAGLLPSDMTAVITLNVEIRPLLQTIVDALGPDEIELMNSTIRDVARYSPNWKVDGVASLVAYLGRTLGDEVTLAIRPLDHEVPAGSQPLPLIAVVLHVKDIKLWNELDDAIVRGSKALGVPEDKRLKVEEGVGTRKWLGVVGLPMEEFAYIVLDPDPGTGSGTAVIGTSEGLVHEIVSVYTNSRSSLATRTSVRAAATSFGEARANFVAWVDVAGLQTVLAPFAEWIAEDATRIDFVPLRLTKRKELLGTAEFAKYRGQEGALPEDVEKLLNSRLDALLDKVEQQRRGEEIPKLAAAWTERQQWLTLFKSLGLALRLGDKDAEIHVLAETVMGS